MIDAILRSCARCACRQPWFVLVGGLIVAVASTVYSSLELRLNADTDDLIAPDRPFMHAYRELLDEFGDLEYLYVVVQKPEDNGARAEACIDFIASRLTHITRADDSRVLPGILSVIEPHEQLRLATRAMSDEQLRELAEVSGAFDALLAEDADPGMVIQGALSRLDRLVREGLTMPPSEQERLASEAIYLAKTLAAALPASSSHAELAMLLQHDLQREYLRSESGELYFIAIMPEKDYGTLQVIQEPLRLIREVLDEARSEFPDLALGLTGKPVLQADELATTDRDMTRAAILAIALIALCFMLVLGGFWHPALAVVALLFGIAWTFGLTTLVLGQLNLLSIVFTLILVAIGIDFGVHLVTRYREERGKRSIEDAVTRTLRTAGRGNVMGAITSSIAFLMALFTHFQGLRELGFIAGAGLLLCLLSMTLILPALLVVFDRRFPAKIGSARGERPPAGAWEVRIWNRLLDRPARVLVIIGLMTAALLPGTLRTDFEYNLLELQAKGLESVKWERRILDDSAETWFGAVIVETQEEALDVIERAEVLPTVVNVRSVFDLIKPDTPERDRLRASLHQFDLHERADRLQAPPQDDLAVNIETLAERLSSIIARGAESAGAVNEAAYVDSIADELRALAASVPTDEVEHTVRHISDSLRVMLHGDRMALRDAMPRAVRDQFVSEPGRYLVTLHPYENVWEFEPMSRFVADMRRVDPDATGVPITQYESLIEMRSAFQTAAGLAFLAVFALLWLDLRSIRDAMLAVMPLLLGMVWLVSAMGWLGITFNLANFFAVPILIGIGVDSGIHIMRRHREDPPGRPQLGTTRRAVFMTSITSLIGFGCLMMASHLGLRSLGMVMAMGAASLLIASAIVLPVLLAWLERHHWYHGGRESVTSA